MSNLRTILLRSRRLALLTLVCLLPLAWLACKGGGGGGGDEGGGGGGGGGATPLVIPAPGDWTNRGSTGLSASGVLNQWNYRIDGAISPCAAVKRGSTYYLYYIGADGNRSSDGGPRRRALGVATSSNGLSFTNSGNNPVVTHIRTTTRRRASSRAPPWSTARTRCSTTAA
jgi:hypothetical protein